MDTHPLNYQQVNPELMEQVRATTVKNCISNALLKRGSYNVRRIETPDEQPGSLHLALTSKTVFHRKVPSVEQQAKMWEATLTSLGIVNPEMVPTEQGVIFLPKTVAAISQWLQWQAADDVEHPAASVVAFGVAFSNAAAASKGRGAA